MKKNQNIQFKPAFYSKRITSAELTNLHQQTAHLLQAHLPMLQVLTLLIQTHVSHQRLCHLLHQIKKDIQSGYGYANALRRHPRYFSSFLCGLIHIGEQSGTLSLLLSQFAKQTEKEKNIRKKIYSLLIYPSILLISTIGLLYFFIQFLIPEFENFLAQFNQTIPWITQILLTINKNIQTYFLPGLSVFIVCMTYFFIAYQKKSSFRETVDTCFIHLPILGKLVGYYFGIRFTHILRITLSAGLPLLEALRVIAPLFLNLAHKNAILILTEHIRQGIPLTQALSNNPTFSQIMVQWIQIGEETGQLEVMLKQLNHYYETHLESYQEALAKLLEPCLILFIGGLIGSVVFALYLPIFSLGEAL